MKLTESQQSVINELNMGCKLYSSYPYTGLPFKAVVVWPNGMTCRLARNTFMALIKKQAIGNPILRTNRQYEYFVSSPSK